MVRLSLAVLPSLLFSCTLVYDDPGDLSGLEVPGDIDPDRVDSNSEPEHLDLAPEQALLADGDGDGYSAAEDCDDSDYDVFPGASEICNQADDDCDGAVDEEAIDPLEQYVDTDGDGFGSGDPVFACSELPDHAALDGDCDEQDSSVHPEQTTYFAKASTNGYDYNCDGSASAKLKAVFTCDNLCTDFPANGAWIYEGKPACGETGMWADDCYPECDGEVGVDFECWCTYSWTQKTQTCR